MTEARDTDLDAAAMIRAVLRDDSEALDVLLDTTDLRPVTGKLARWSAEWLAGHARLAGNDPEWWLEQVVRHHNPGPEQP